MWERVSERLCVRDWMKKKVKEIVMKETNQGKIPNNKRFVREICYFIYIHIYIFNFFFLFFLLFFFFSFLSTNNNKIHLILFNFYISYIFLILFFGTLNFLLFFLFYFFFICFFLYSTLLLCKNTVYSWRRMCIG